MELLPGWDSVERVTKFAHAYELLGLISLALLVAFDVLTFAYNQRKDTLIAAAAAPQRLTAEQRHAMAKSLEGRDAQPLEAEIERALQPTIGGASTPRSDGSHCEAHDKRMKLATGVGEFVYRSPLISGFDRP